MKKTIDFLYWSIGVLFVTAVICVAVFYHLVPDDDLGPFGLIYVVGISILIWCMIIGVFCWIVRRAYLTFKKDER